MTTKNITRDQIIDNTVCSVREKLNKLSPEIAKPSDMAMRIAFSDCHTKRRVNGRYKFRATRPFRNESREEGFQDLGDMLWRLVKFHSSHGDLWSYPHEYTGDSLFEAMETVAIILTGSPAVQRWEKSL